MHQRVVIWWRIIHQGVAILQVSYVHQGVAILQVSYTRELIVNTLKAATAFIATILHITDQWCILLSNIMRYTYGLKKNYNGTPYYRLYGV